MPETDIGEALATDLTNAFTDYDVDPEVLDGSGQEKETKWISDTWTESLGYYKSIPEFKTAVDAKANWTIGAGYEADDMTVLVLDTITGNGKDTFNSIIKNMIKVKTIDSDAYAEIIRDERGNLANLKPIDPSMLRIVHNDKGRIKRYELLDRYRRPLTRFQPHEIFHLSNERIGNEIHGVRILDSLMWLIKARNEAMNDWKRVLHRNVEPLWIFHLDTDDTDKISAFKAKMDAARGSGENMYIPKGAVVPELVATAQNAGLNPLQWINQLNDYFFQAVNVPQIIVGNSKEFTDASGKIVYLAYEQSVKNEQMYIEEQVLRQLNLYIELTFPASLQNELISSREQDSALAASAPNDTTAEMEGRT